MASEIIIIDKAEIDVFRSEGSTAVKQARDLANGICDALTLDKAAKFMLAVKERAKRISDRLSGPKKDARKDWQNWIDLENELIEPYMRIEKEIIKPAMAQFHEETEQKRREEEARRYAEAKKRTEDDKLLAAQQAEANGEKELADSILDQPIIVAPVTVPKIETPAGISYRDVWKYRISDLSQVPREYLVLDEKKVGAVVRALKGETRIPGIQAFCEKTVAGRL